jgi:hypothetical protein
MVENLAERVGCHRLYYTITAVKLGQKARNKAAVYRVYSFKTRV